MTEPIRTRPDALVLGVGGTLGIAWLRGVLAGLTEHAGIDFRDCEYLVGTSAGSVVAASLAAGQAPTAEGAPADEELADDDPGAADPARRRGAAMRWAGALAAPVTPALLRAGAPGGRMLRRAALRAGPRPERRFDGLGRYLASLGAEFDGRLRIVAVDRASGRRIVFGEPGAPAATVREAVLASCAIPWVIAPVEIGGREYVDGGLWSATNLDVLPAARHSEVLCLIPTGSRGAARSVLAAYGALTRATAQTEALALKAHGARVRLVRPDAGSAQAMGGNLMASGRRSAVLAAGYAQGRRLALRG